MRTHAGLVVAGCLLAATLGGGGSASATTGAEQTNPMPERSGCAASSPAGASATDAPYGRFGIELLTAISGEGGKNALVSPLGIGTALSMAAQGAAAPVRAAIRHMLESGGGNPGEVPVPESEEAREGDREDPLLCRLGRARSAADEDEGVELHMANAAFAEQHLDLFPAFAAALRDRYRARVERLDFSDPESLTRINAWVARETAGAIPSLLSHLEPDAVLVLANAMHFRGSWSQPFDPALTRPLPFHGGAGAPVEVATMHANGISVPYREDESFQALSLPYGDGAFALTVVLPRAGLAASVALRRLAADPSWLGGSGFERSHGRLALPRAALNGKESLLPILRGLGLESSLELDHGGFAGIAWPAPILSRVEHSTMLVLDERGTEAAAATAVILAKRAAIREDEGFEMQVDRPFALALRHESTGSLLFAAWVSDPSGS